MSKEVNLSQLFFRQPQGFCYNSNLCEIWEGCSFPHRGPKCKWWANIVTLKEMLYLYSSTRFCNWFYQEAHVLFITTNFTTKKNINVCFQTMLSCLSNTVKPRLSQLVVTRRNSLDNDKSRVGIIENMNIDEK